MKGQKNHIKEGDMLTTTYNELIRALTYFNIRFISITNNGTSRVNFFIFSENFEFFWKWVIIIHEGSEESYKRRRHVNDDLY